MTLYLLPIDIDLFRIIFIGIEIVIGLVLPETSLVFNHLLHLYYYYLLQLFLSIKS